MKQKVVKLRPWYAYMAIHTIGYVAEQINFINTSINAKGLPFWHRTFEADNVAHDLDLTVSSYWLFDKDISSYRPNVKREESFAVI